MASSRASSSPPSPSLSTSIPLPPAADAPSSCTGIACSAAGGGGVVAAAGDGAAAPAAAIPCAFAPAAAARRIAASAALYAAGAAGRAPPPSSRPPARAATSIRSRGSSGLGAHSKSCPTSATSPPNRNEPCWPLMASTSLACWLFRALNLSSCSSHTMCASSWIRVSRIRRYLRKPRRSSVRRRREISCPRFLLKPRRHTGETPTFPSGGISVSTPTLYLCFSITPTMPGSEARRWSRFRASEEGGVSPGGCNTR
mmetsp:Transcript_50107/g.160450  ORF Transcript_50107/g.160450 Transcript_50107/m.160450 type:complete len:256 (-) Transcript_50107:479-1246(-)